MFREVWARFVDGEYGRPFSMDKTTRALTTISYPHHEIHSWSYYYLKSWLDIPNDGVIDLRITPSNTIKWGHFFPVAATESQYKFHIYEGAVITNTGTTVTPLNRNRNLRNGVSPDQSTVAVDYIYNTSLALANADTDITGATDIYPCITGSGRQIGGDRRDENEIILRQGITYSLRAECVAAGWVDYLVGWYEHTNKE